jgi:hypothetical protein
MKLFYKTFLLLLLNVSLLVFNSFGQVAPGIQWQNTIGGNDEDHFWSIEQTSDGGYILGGHSKSNISSDKTENCIGDYDYWVVKTDSIGDIQWQNTIGGSLDDELYSVKQTFDGGYILGGYSNSNISGDKTENCIGYHDYWIIKLDASGNIDWQNTIGGSYEDRLFSLDQTLDSGYVLLGESASNISGDKTENVIGDYDYWVVKTDVSGNIQWQNTIGGNYNDNALTIQHTNDKGYILGGYSTSDSSADKTENSLGGEDCWIVKIDSAGNVQWDNTIGGSGSDHLLSVQQTDDNGYILASSSESNISGDKTENSIGGQDYWVIKIDSSGTIQWQKTIGGSYDDFLYCARQTTDGGYILGGYSWSDISGDKTDNSFGMDDYWVIKTDSSGIIQWQKTIGGSNFDEPYSLQQTSDNGYILGGRSNSDISGNKTENCLGNYDYWIVKLFPDTITSINQLPQLPNYPITISPNPSSGIFQITFSSASNQKSNYTLEVINTLGQAVFKSEILNPESQINLNLSFLPNGIYIIKAFTDKGVLQQKLLIHH